MGIGTSISTAVSERTAVVIEDYMFDASTAGELKPEESPKDFHDTWDLDGTDFTPEASPDDEGYWDDFENIVLNHNYEELGSELVTNGDFATDSDWTKSAGWTIANGVATHDSSAGASTLQATGLSAVAGKTYKISYNATNLSGGYIRADFGGVTGALNFSDVDFVGYITTTTTGGLYILSSADVTLDNVSIKQVDPNDRWTLGTGWTIEDGKAVSAGHSTHSSCTQTLSLPIGQYEVSLNVTVTSGSFSIQAQGSGTDTGSVITSSGVHTEIFTTTKNRTTFSIRSNDGNGVGSIHDVTVKEYAITPLDV